MLAITVVAGNVSVEQGTHNALFTAELCESSSSHILRSSGAVGAPARRCRLVPRPRWPGRSRLSTGLAAAEDEFAVDAMVRVIEANPGIELITLGPLTNLALALRQSPQLAANVSRCVVMGGAPCCEGNVTPAAEYNFWVDPEAARVVLRSQLPIELVGWQLSRGSAVVNEPGNRRDSRAAAPASRNSPSDANDTAAQAYRTQTGEEGIALPDPTAMAILLDPALALVSSDHYMDVQVDSGITRGMSVVDKLGVAEDARNRAAWSEVLERGRKHKVIWEMDIPGWKQALLRALA